MFCIDSESPPLTPCFLTPNAENKPCNEIRKIVFIKIHKTGSTTMASILERFGYIRNLTFAVPPIDHYFSITARFNSTMVLRIPKRSENTYDMLVNHARYNRKEMDSVVPNATFISIIRNPVNQFESEYGYYEYEKHMKVSLSAFLNNPQKYYSKRGFLWYSMRNGQLFDFGLDHKYEDNSTYIQRMVERVSKEIDLMMINEYYDESLILLKQLMCWEFDDILYIPKGIRSNSHRVKMSEELSDKIRKWNAADVMLYEHFNRTFWEKILAYGPNFETDLATFRALKHNVTENCVDPFKKNTKDKREDKFVLRNNSCHCRNIMYDDVAYTQILRKTMIARATAESKAKGS